MAGSDLGAGASALALLATEDEPESEIEEADGAGLLAAALWEGLEVPVGERVQPSSRDASRKGSGQHACRPPLVTRSVRPGATSHTSR